MNEVKPISKLDVKHQATVSYIITVSDSIPWEIKAESRYFTPELSIRHQRSHEYTFLIIRVVKWALRYIHIQCAISNLNWAQLIHTHKIWSALLFIALPPVYRWSHKLSELKTSKRDNRSLIKTLLHSWCHTIFFQCNTHLLFYKLADIVLRLRQPFELNYSEMYKIFY